MCPPDWLWPVQGIPCLLPKFAGIDSSSPMTLTRTSGIEKSMDRTRVQFLAWLVLINDDSIDTLFMQFSIKKKTPLASHLFVHRLSNFQLLPSAPRQAEFCPQRRRVSTMLRSSCREAGLVYWLALWPRHPSPGSPREGWIEALPCLAAGEWKAERIEGKMEIKQPLFRDLRSCKVTICCLLQIHSFIPRLSWCVILSNLI